MSWWSWDDQGLHNMWKNRHMRTVTNYFIVNLSFADVLVTIICLPASLVVDITETWFFGKTLCKVVPYLQTISVSVSVLTLSCIAQDRWYAICHPLMFKSTAKRARKSIVVIWVVSCIIMIPQAIVMECSSLLPELTNKTSLFTVCDEHWGDSWKHIGVAEEVEIHSVLSSDSRAGRVCEGQDQHKSLGLSRRQMTERQCMHGLLSHTGSFMPTVLQIPSSTIFSVGSSVKSSKQPFLAIVTVMAKIEQRGQGPERAQTAENPFQLNLSTNTKRRDISAAAEHHLSIYSLTAAIMQLIRLEAAVILGFVIPQIWSLTFSSTPSDCLAAVYTCMSDLCKSEQAFYAGTCEDERCQIKSSEVCDITIQTVLDQFPSLQGCVCAWDEELCDSIQKLATQCHQRPVYDSTGSCLEQMRVCVSDAVCNRYLAPVLQACMAEGCDHDRCQQATQQFYGSMPQNVAEMLVMCDCEASDQSCLHMKNALHSGTCRKETWICKDTVSLCVKDRHCRVLKRKDTKRFHPPQKSNCDAIL
ncbi:hypothetical protein PAMP_001758 [Pampus punctatissimus]